MIPGAFLTIIFYFLFIQHFEGNRDRDTIVYNKINPPIKARYIKIRPQAWYRHICMRTELYGCLEDVSGGKDCVIFKPTRCA